jgi:tetratricopeptide (TPR) repeat protein
LGGSFDGWRYIRAGLVIGEGVARKRQGYLRHPAYSCNGDVTMPSNIQGITISGLLVLVLLLSPVLLPATAGGVPGPDETTPPTNATGWNDLGNIYFSQLRFDRAADAYSHAISLDPGFARAYFNRGKSYAELGFYNEAIADYEKAIECDPSLKGVVENFLDIAVRNRYVTLPGEALLKGSSFPGGQYLAVDNTRGRYEIVVALAPR